MKTLNYKDKDFLKKLDQFATKISFVKITALNLKEEPLETIEGRITQGSINIDGASAIRRTCSLTLLTETYDYNNYVWGLNTRFKLEIGLQNLISENYDDIIWFNQGVYIITSFNTTRNANNFSITISGKDKMCLLNGEVGGAFESEITLGEIEEEKVISKDANGNTIETIPNKRKLSIEDIIKNMLHIYAREPLHNIVIKDLPNYGLELLEYRGEEPIYAYKHINGTQWENILTYMDKEKTLLYKTDSMSNYSSIKLKNLPDEVFTSLTDSLTFKKEGKIKFSSTSSSEYLIAKFEYGDTSGYNATELIYPGGELIAKPGETITSVLDKIKNILIQFEYFYDLDGRFIFQKKQSFTGNLWSLEKKDEKGQGYIDVPLIDDNQFSYIFDDLSLITTFNSNPNISNLKNDFSIWGSRKGILGAAIPIHMRYAIDRKPIQYTSLFVLQKEVDVYNNKYQTNLKPQESVTYSIYPKPSGTSEEKWKQVDWREIIYRMANDHSKFKFLTDFENRVGLLNSDFYKSGITGYEQYYNDVLGFWRQLYNPEPNQDEYNDFYPSNETDYYKRYWNKKVFYSPESLNFWFDFLDSEGSQLDKYNVNNIGQRSKVINDNKINSIYYRDTPTVIYTDNYDNQIATGYLYAQLPKNYENLFSISAQGLSAKDKLNDLLYQHAFCVENVTINTAPIYYLEPNTLIKIKDEKLGINDDYVISKITLPLAYNGTMSITATKAVQSII